MISSGNFSGTLDDVHRVTTQAQITSYYLGIKDIPCIICSPLRRDEKPSMGIYSPDGTDVNFIDFGTGERGSIFTLLRKMWNTSFADTLKRICGDFTRFSTSASVRASIPSCRIVGTSDHSRSVDMQCKVREWRDYDIEYWESYGVPLKWLKYADVYPISHKIIIKNGNNYVFGADKYAYAYVEFKEGKTTLKIYQPYNKSGFKWATTTNKSVWSLWTKIPKTGNNLIIASSLKDCLNLWSNTGIPAICLQGEGYLPKESVIRELKERFKNIIVFYDNDFTSERNAGREDSIRIAQEFDLKRVELPEEFGCKDPSDLYKTYGKEKYLEIITNILKDVLWKSGEK